MLQFTIGIFDEFELIAIEPVSSSCYNSIFRYSVMYINSLVLPDITSTILTTSTQFSL